MAVCKCVSGPLLLFRGACSVSAQIPCDSLEIQTRNCGSPTSELKSQVQRANGFSTENLPCHFLLPYRQQRIQVLFAFIIGGHIKAADLLSC